MKSKTVVTICLGSSCYRRGNQAILEIVKDYLAKNNLESKVEFKGHLCTGNCTKGPNLKIDADEYHRVDENSVIEILNRYFVPEKSMV